MFFREHRRHSLLSLSLLMAYYLTKDRRQHFVLRVQQVCSSGNGIRLGDFAESKEPLEGGFADPVHQWLVRARGDPESGKAADRAVISRRDGKSPMQVSESKILK